MLLPFSIPSKSSTTCLKLQGNGLKVQINNIMLDVHTENTYDLRYDFYIGLSLLSHKKLDHT